MYIEVMRRIERGFRSAKQGVLIQHSNICNIVHVVGLSYWFDYLCLRRSLPTELLSSPQIVHNPYGKREHSLFIRFFILFPVRYGDEFVMLNSVKD